MGKMGRVLSAYETLTKRYAVSIEDVLEIQRRRASFRTARMYRKRSRRRTIEANGGRPSRKRRVIPIPVQYAGEGELHALLREAGLSIAQFCALAGITVKTFHRWEGHPIALWPIQLLFFFIWSKNMAKRLKVSGWNPDDFKPKGVPPAPGGRYPRTPDQVRTLIDHVQREANKR